MKNKSIKELKPVLKWAGGKRQIIEKLREHMPLSFNRYFEPFIGAGALLFDLKPKDAFINDINFEISNLYKVLSDKEKTFTLIDKLNEIQSKHNQFNDLEKASDFYYSIRHQDRELEYKNKDDVEVMVRTIYLNKASFNGIYRLNSEGYFNVPFNNKINLNLFDKNNLIDINDYLRHNKITIYNTDFVEAVREAKKGDFVYFDPPYDEIQDKKSFVGYSKTGFSKKDQIRLADLFKELDKKGVFVMLSNHNTEFIRNLYKEYRINIVLAKRIINSKGNGRGQVEEVIITNYEKD
jgi:DNA adenine methylase